ncbi:MAG: 6-phosphogluconolactonase [Betaproteobacteria bacterium]|nr:6-phosphogluconolactonase [Betaproteobacteria bacterium]
MPSTGRFDTAAGRVAAIVESVSASLREALQARGKAGLIVSGGSTPRPVFAALAGQPLEWNKVYVTLADERWVGPDDQDSNERLVRQNLLRDAAASAHFIPLKNAAADAAAGAPETDQALTAFPWPADVLMLGMGEDGHTASLFPRAPELQAALHTDMHCIAVTPPAAPHQRLSLSADALLDARAIIIDITGPAKWATYERAAAPGPLEEMPVRLVLQQQRVPVHVYWSP